MCFECVKEVFCVMVFFISDDKVCVFEVVVVVLLCDVFCIIDVNVCDIECGCEEGIGDLLIDCL